MCIFKASHLTTLGSAPEQARGGGIGGTSGRLSNAMVSGHFTIACSCASQGHGVKAPYEGMKGRGAAHVGWLDPDAAEKSWSNGLG